MKIEGIKVGDYFRKTWVHFAILLVWAFASFVISYFIPVVTLAMTLIAPIPMIVVFGHLGGRFKKIGQAVFAGILVGFITGAVSGFLMANEAVWQLYIPILGSKLFAVLAYASLITIARAFFGGICALLGWSLFRGKFK